MPSVTIRNVPPEIHSRLRELAEASGRSLQEFLLSALEGLALEARPTTADIFREIEARFAEERRLGVPTPPPLSAEEVLGWIHEGRPDEERL